MTLRGNNTRVTFRKDEVLISRQVGLSNSSYIAIKIKPEESWDFVITKVDRLVSMDDDMFKEMCRIAKYNA